MEWNFSLMLLDGDYLILDAIRHCLRTVTCHHWVECDLWIRASLPTAIIGWRTPAKQKPSRSLPRPLILPCFLQTPMADKDVILLSFRTSVFGLRVQIALAEKEVDYEFKEEDISNKSPLLLELNPVHKKIPVLIHYGKPVCESSIIIQYIDEVWIKGPSFLPKDPLQRANARFWADFIDKMMYNYGLRVLRNKGDVQATANKEFLGILKQLEGELGEKPFFGGETLGYVDIVLVPFSCWFYTFETFGGFSIEEENPKLMAWVRRCNERESVSKVLPDPHKIYEHACGFRKRLGLE